MRFFDCVAAVAAVSTLAFPAPAPAVDPQRGENLYSQRCLDCHAESVHARAKRSARDFETIRAWVRHWNSFLKLGWSADEVEDVAAYLNARYYGFAPPAAATLRDVRNYSYLAPPLRQVFPPSRW